MQRSVEKLVAQALVHCLVYEQANQRALQKTELSSKKKLWYFGSEAGRADLCVWRAIYVNNLSLYRCRFEAHDVCGGSDVV